MPEGFVSPHCFAVMLGAAHGDLPRNMITGPFLLSLWWRELAFLAALLCLAVLAAIWIALRVQASNPSRVDSNSVDINQRIKELSEEL